MSSRATTTLCLIMVAAAVAMSVAVYSRLPEQVASHWNVADQVDGTMPRFWGAFLMPAISLPMLGLLMLVPRIDPHRANIAQFQGSVNVFTVLMVAFLLYLHILTLLWNLGVQGFRISTALLPAVGILFVFIGFLLRGSKRNYFIGIRTPWTLSSDEVWEQTHGLGSVLFMISGFLAALGAFLPGPVAYVLVVGPVLLSSLIAVVYSYVLWRAEQTRA